MPKIFYESYCFFTWFIKCFEDISVFSKCVMNWSIVVAYSVCRVIILLLVLVHYLSVGGNYYYCLMCNQSVTFRKLKFFSTRTYIMSNSHTCMCRSVEWKNKSRWNISNVMPYLVLPCYDVHIIGKVLHVSRRSNNILLL